MIGSQCPELPEAAKLGKLVKTSFWGDPEVQTRRTTSLYKPNMQTHHWSRKQSQEVGGRAQTGMRGEGEHTREFSGAGRERRADRTSSKPVDLSAHARSISPPGHIVTFRKIPARSTSTFHSRVCSFSSSGKTEPSLSHFLKEEWEERAFHRQNRWSKLFRPTPGCFAPKTCLSPFYAVVCTTTPPIFSSS